MCADAPVRYVSAGLEELRSQSIQAIAIALLGVIAYVFLLIAAQPAQWGLEPMLVVAALAGTATTAYLLLSLGVLPAASALVIGLLVAITVALYSFSDDLFATIYPLTAVIAGILLGWRHAAVVGLANGVLVLGISVRSPNILPMEVAETVLLLIAINLVVSWLLSRPTHAALDWAWTNYREVLEKIEEARARQAELARLSAELSDACQRLEVANDELERARKAAVEARQLKAEYAAAISHELRTPLNLIIGFSEMMVIAPHTYEGETLPEGYRGDIEAIYRNACHLSSLVDDVLDLAQVDAHRMALEKNWISLDKIIDEAVATVGTLYKDRGLSIRKELPDGLPSLYVDAIRIRQVLINLLNNAARFTVAGGTTIGAMIEGQDVIVSVEDTGVGIPPEELPSVFKEFHHATGPSVGPYGGRGLGLTICRRFVELHGGSMWVESAPSKGAKFSFSLPLSQNVMSTPIRATWETWARPSHVQVEPTVAVLTSDDTSADAFRRYLEGVRVVRVHDLDHAQRLAARRPLRAVIVATRSDANQLATAARNASELRDVLTIVCPLRTRATANLDLCVSQYLVKPVDREQLRAALTSLKKRIARVMVVEDDSEMVSLLSRMLRSLSRRYQITTVSNGAEAIATLRKKHPDVVLLDLLMPGIDGYKVIEAMQRDETLASVPVIVVTARGRENELITAEEFSIQSSGGLSVGEVMGYLQVLLEGIPAMLRQRREQRLPSDRLNQDIARTER